VLIIVDNGGNVYQFYERRLNRRKDGSTRCIFTGCKGEALKFDFILLIFF
jgi:GMP synthase-like glutamine amidotransferase